MSEFLFVFRGGTNPSAPAEMQAQMQRWIGWMDDLKARGHFQTGKPLDPTGKTLRGKQKAVTDAPYAEAKDLVGGFMLVTARDLGHATELARGCPILDTDGTVEVRPIRVMAM